MRSGNRRPCCVRLTRCEENELPVAQASIVEEVQERFPNLPVVTQAARDQIPTLWIPQDRLREVLRFLKSEVAQPYEMLYDLSAIDERVRANREGQPASDFTVVYHLIRLHKDESTR